MNPALILRLSLSVMLVAAGVTSAGGLQSAADDPAAGDVHAIVEKTNLYVKALNAISSVQRTYDRYTSWIDVKKGFTGRERYISYGLYEINSSMEDDIRRAAEKGPQMKPPLPAFIRAHLRRRNRVAPRLGFDQGATRSAAT